MTAAEGKRLLDRLAAEPRPSGSKAEATARQICADFLRGRGMEVEEESFAYSALSGRWSVVITGLIALAIGGALLTANRSTVLHVAPIGILALGTASIFFEFAVLGLPIMRRYGTNLTATRGAPKVWLAAHLDSKSQRVSMRMRILAVSLVVQSVLLVLILWLGAFVGAMAPVALWRVAGGFLAAGGLMLAFCTVGSESSGAVDDAAGVAAVLLAATRTREPVQAPQHW